MKLKLLILSLILIACQSRSGIKENNNIDHFIIGQGGGFSGMYEQFKISSDGIIERFDQGSQEYLGYKQLSKDEAKTIFSLYDPSRLRGLSMDTPGNMTRFIIIPGDKQNPDHRLTWPMEAEIDDSVDTLFGFAWDACKDQ